IAVVGSLTNHIFTGQTTSANDAALASMTSLFDKGFLLYTILYLLAIAFVAPFMEELAYRALPAELFFEGRLKVLTGLVTSILFGLPHASNLPEFIMYSLIGAVLYLAYQRRGNIKDAILLHVLNNLPAGLYFLWLAFQ
ncbi:CPBP family intramembrane glutamic endopeptidase, partial [Streptococcus ferus]|uniref:CPBP family intramembrane glutamic endopeptidase n=1 Tax=Streptococcus ferus TaxID=1345 RepID=UPI0035A1B0F3